MKRTILIPGVIRTETSLQTGFFFNKQSLTSPHSSYQYSSAVLNEHLKQLIEQWSTIIAIIVKLIFKIHLFINPIHYKLDCNTTVG